MTSDITRTIPRYVAGAALSLTVLAFAFGDVQVGLGAVAGTMVAVLDALAITWLTTRVIGGAGFIRPGFAALLLGAKLVLLLAVCWALLARWGVEPVGFSVGLGGLVLGMLLGGIEVAFKQSRIVEEG